MDMYPPPGPDFEVRISKLVRHKHKSSREGYLHRHRPHGDSTQAALGLCSYVSLWLSSQGVRNLA